MPTIFAEIGGRLRVLRNSGRKFGLTESEMARLLGASGGVSPSQALIDAALTMHVNDNVTAVVIEVAG